MDSSPDEATPAEKRQYPYDPFAADPFPSYDEARERCPVHYQPGFGDGFYSLFRYDDVVDVFKNLERWSADEGQGPLRVVEGGLRSDPPEHTIYRRLVTGAFTAKRTAALEPFIRASARELVAAMSPAGRGDLIAQVAAPLPVTVISHILGIPAEERDEFRRLSDQFMESQLTSDLGVLNASKEAIYAVFRKEISDRRRDVSQAGGASRPIPDDMLSSLVVAEHDGKRFTVEELLPLLLLLLVGGIETTTSLIASLVRRLLEAGLWERALADDAELLVAIEESLRFDPPVLGLFRTTRAPLELHGVGLPGDAKVMGVFAAANRDPSVWTDADTFSLDRSREELRRHLSFGAGIWLCPGAALARLEAQVALQSIAELLPGLRLDGEPRQESRFLTWGPQYLPLAWDSSQWRQEQSPPQ